MVKLTSQSDARKATRCLQINRLPSEFSRANYVLIHRPEQTWVLHQHHQTPEKAKLNQLLIRPTRFSSFLNQTSAVITLIDTHGNLWWTCC